MSSPFEKKSVYHSGLVKESPIEVTITCDKPQQSKFNGKADFISFKCDGEEHFYEVENDECAEALTGYKGQTVTLIATGSRGDARIEVEDAGGGHDERPARREERSDRQPERRQEHGGDTGDRKAKELKTFTHAKVFSARAAVLLDICLHHAERMAKEHFGADATTEDVRALAVTLFIESKSMVNINDLPVKFIDTKKQEPAQREPEPRREEPPANDDADAESLPF